MLHEIFSLPHRSPICTALPTRGPFPLLKQLNDIDNYLYSACITLHSGVASRLLLRTVRYCHIHAHEPRLTPYLSNLPGKDCQSHNYDTPRSHFWGAEMRVPTILYSSLFLCLPISNSDVQVSPRNLSSTEIYLSDVTLP